MQRHETGEQQPEGWRVRRSANWSMASRTASQPSDGALADVEKLTLADVKRFYEAHTIRQCQGGGDR